MRRVLLCSPYLRSEHVVSGGINMWGANILSFYDSINTNINIDPISYDRVFDVKENTGVITRLFYGFRDYRQAIKLTKLKLRSGKYDIMHLCSSAQLSLFKDLYLLRYARKQNTKAIIHLHFGRIPDLFEKNNWETWLLKIICRTANTVVVMDEKSYFTLCASGFNNIQYLPNPLSPSITNRIEQIKGIERYDRKLLYVGHIIPSKGIFELVEACATIPNIELYLVGSIDQTIRTQLSAFVKDLDFGGVLHIVGAIPHDEVIREMLSAGIFVLPSYTEGFPNVILEAMACECPIVATNVGAIPQMLNIDTKNRCGICVSPKNVKDLRRAIMKLLEDREYALQCGKIAKDRVNEKYSMQFVWNELVKIWC